MSPSLGFAGRAMPRGIDLLLVFGVFGMAAAAARGLETPSPSAPPRRESRERGGQDSGAPSGVVVPLGLDAEAFAASIPPGNPMTPAKVALGKQLYFDPRLSLDDSVSCASCHDPARGWTDQQPFSFGVNHQVGGRNAPPVFNTTFFPQQFWDGRAASLEEQAKGPLVNPVEMAMPSHDYVVAKLQGIAGYREAFPEVFGGEITIDRIAMAIATFERTILSGNSRYDRYVRDKDAGALSDAEIRGMELAGAGRRLGGRFDPATFGKARCNNCHTPPTFSDGLYHNLGVGWDRNHPDLGRYLVTGEAKDLGAFKTPSLRSLPRTAPYFHDGSARTLEEVVALYNRGGIDNPFLSSKMKPHGTHEPLGLTPEEEADLVAFLRALDGEPVEIEPPELPR